MDRAEIDRMEAERKAEEQKLKDIVAEFEAQKSKMETELQALEKELPYLLADVALGKVKKAEVTKIKRRRREIKEFLEDFGPTCVGFKRVEAHLGHEGMRIDRLKSKVRSYEVFEE